MTRFSRRDFVFCAVPLAAALLFGAGTAYAEMSKKVIAAFKGKVLVSQGRLEGTDDDKETVAIFKGKSLSEVTGHTNSQNAWEWTFNYTAFLSGGGSSSARLQFYQGMKYIAEKTIPVEPKDTVLEGELTIDESSGLQKDKNYTLKVVTTTKGKEVILATSSPLTMK